MKTIIFAILLITTMNCKSQHNKIEELDTMKDIEKVEQQANILKERDSIMMKNGRLDVMTLKEKGVPSSSNTLTDDGWISSNSYSYEENFSDGMYVYITGNENSGYNKTTRKKDDLFEVYTEYYPSGETKQIGELFTNEFTAGIWYWFSESGEIEKYKDYDAPYKFSWEDVKSFLKEHKIKKEDINQIGREVQEGVPLWYISFKTKELQNTDNVQQYILDGTTGKIVQKELLDISRELD